MRRKTFKLEEDLLNALALLANETGKSPDALVDEALRELFKKHSCPTSLKEALRMSLRRLPINDNGNTVKKAR